MQKSVFQDLQAIDSVGLRHRHRKKWSKPADLSRASRAQKRWSTTICRSPEMKVAQIFGTLPF